MSDTNYDPTDSGGGSSLSDIVSGAGSSLGDLAAMAGNFIGNMFSGGGGQAPSPVAQSNATSDANAIVDPSTTAQTAIAGQPAPAQSQPQNPQGPQAQGQAASAYAPQSAVDQLKAALQALRQRQRQNPWETGGGAQSYINRLSGQNSPMLNRAGRIPTGAVPPAAPNPADLPSPNATPAEYEYEGESNQPEYGDYKNPRQYPYPSEGESNQPEYGTGENPRQYPYNSEGASNQPEYGPGRPTPALPDPSGPTGLGQIVKQLFQPPVPIEGLPAPGDPSTLIPPVGPWAAGRNLLTGLRGGLHDTLRAAPQIINRPNVTEGQPPAPSTGDEFRPPEPPAVESGDPFRPDDPAKPAVTKAPATGKPIKTVNPKTNKPVNPKTGNPLPTKKGPPGEYQPTPGNARQPEWRPGIMSDVQGGQGIPPMLGQIAQMALPFLFQALMGGMGGGRGRFGGRGGYWPYHHPGFGWRIHGYHPGGGWRPLDPRHMRGFMGGGLGENSFPFSGGDTGGGPLSYTGGGQGASYNPYYDKLSRYRNPGQPSSTVIGKGPDGQALPYTGEEAADFTDEVASKLGIDQATARKVLAGESSYGQNYTNNREIDGIPSYGPFQLHDSGPGSVGHAFKQATGEDPRDPSTWKDQIVFALRWAAQHGWGPWGAATKAGLSQWAGISGRGKVAAFAWNYGQPHGGVTATGGDTKPNPDGNVAKGDDTPLRLNPLPDTPNPNVAYQP